MEDPVGAFSPNSTPSPLANHFPSKVMGIIALCIVGSCITLLVINKLSQSVDED